MDAHAKTKAAVYAWLKSRNFKQVNMLEDEEGIPTASPPKMLNILKQAWEPVFNTFGDSRPTWEQFERRYSHLFPKIQPFQKPPLEAEKYIGRPAGDHLGKLAVLTVGELAK